MKNDERDATDLVNLLRLGALAEAWIAPPEIRQLREMTGYRYTLSRLRAGLKAQIYAVMGKSGGCRRDGTCSGPAGPPSSTAWSCPSPARCASSVAQHLESLRDLVATYDREIESLDRRIALALRDHAGYRGHPGNHGVGPVLAALFVAEIGDVRRFPHPGRPCSWAGLTPRHRESDTKVRPWRSWPRR